MLKLNRKLDVAVETVDDILYISINGISICKKPLKGMDDAEVIGFLTGVLMREGVFSL